MAIMSTVQMISYEKKTDDFGRPPPSYQEKDPAVEAVRLLAGAYAAEPVTDKDLSKSNSSSQSSLSAPPDYCVDVPEDQKDDPWKECGLPEDNSTPWAELTRGEKAKRVTGWILKPIILLLLLYTFICSLSLMSSAFRLVGGRAAGRSFSSNAIIQNPVAGLMIGIVSTVLVQSSSTSTSIVVTMVASGILTVQSAIPIIMGANIGTSVTNTIVSMMQSADRQQFRRAFGGATVHDMFNWLSVLVFLPLEVATGYLFRLTSAIVGSMNLEGSQHKNQDLLKTITKPLLKMVIQLDKKVITKIAMGDEEYSYHSMVKRWCKYETVEKNVTAEVNVTTVLNRTNSIEYITDLANRTLTQKVKVPVHRCEFLFAHVTLDDTTLGLVLLAISLFMLCVCLVIMVKLLSSMLRGSICTTLKKLLNNEPKNCLLRHMMGYMTILIGAAMTILVQSSSVFTSVLTPLVGLGVIEMERMYPLTLGSNIGTTTTSLLAALAASSDRLAPALQISLCHFFFNISGILLFYPVPAMRWPIALAKKMGDTTAKYRWFALVYLLAMFVLLPGIVFGLSMLGTAVMFGVLGPVAAVLLVVIVINVLQSSPRCKRRLPKKLQSWDYLPKSLHSLAPLDSLFVKLMSVFKKCCPRCKSSKKSDTSVASGQPLCIEAELEPINAQLQPINAQALPVAVL